MTATSGGHPLMDDAKQHPAIDHHTADKAELDDIGEDQRTTVSEHLDVSTLTLTDKDNEDIAVEESKTAPSADASAVGINSPNFFDCRIAVVGNVDSGKVSGQPNAYQLLRRKSGAKC